ncbi:G-alpha-domain-containing protein [Trametopsis cervina]|nr:G-alpha-domain-containing protein [Trametopsis cervina]
MIIKHAGLARRIRDAKWTAPFIGTVIDEAHCILEWKKEFRTAFGEIDKTRSFLAGKPIFATSATLTPSMLEESMTDISVSRSNSFILNVGNRNPDITSLVVPLKFSDNNYASLDFVLDPVADDLHTVLFVSCPPSPPSQKGACLQLPYTVVNVWVETATAHVIPFPLRGVCALRSKARSEWDIRSTAGSAQSTSYPALRLLFTFPVHLLPSFLFAFSLLLFVPLSHPLFVSLFPHPLFASPSPTPPTLTLYSTRFARMGRAEDDPLTLALAPPAGETDEQRTRRLRDEAEARRVSDEIDSQLREERAALRKKKKPIKVLLLGQSESDFQLTYAKQAWSTERAAWRTIIQLNLLRNVNTILDVLANEMSASSSSSSASSSHEFSDSEDDSDDPPGPSTASTSSSNKARPRTSTSTQAAQPQPPLRFTEKHRLLKLRLLPLRSVQSDIQARLGLRDYPTLPASSSSSSSSSQGDTGAGGKRQHESFVWSHVAWKTGKGASSSSQGGGGREGEGREGGGGNGGGGRRATEESETQEIIASCKQDMQALWADEVVQEMLRRRRLRLDLMPGFFLQDVARIARRDYAPSDDDVVRARLRTLGVQEHRILFETGPAAGTEWFLYDVGGSRTQRPAWFPYFDDCNAIIFLAPISCFDEKLAEERKVNRRSFLPCVGVWDTVGSIIMSGGNDLFGDAWKPAYAPLNAFEEACKAALGGASKTAYRTLSGGRGLEAYRTPNRGRVSAAYRTLSGGRVSTALKCGLLTR